MEFGDAVEAVYARLEAQRQVSRQHSVELAARLATEGYKVEVVEGVGRWGVQVHDPRQPLLWMTLWCSVYDEKASWEWIRSLDWSVPGHAYEEVVEFARGWIGWP